MALNKKLVVEALKAAVEAARSADPGENADGGTCNFDTPMFYIPRVRDTTIAQIAEEAGVRLDVSSWCGKRFCFLGGVSKGQANRRTVMAEAATRVLSEKLASIPGVYVRTYYAMD